jgi:hypothetical protein
MADVQSEPSRRILISYEAVARASAKMARRFVREIGADKIHIAITLRPPAALLPGRWTEALKSGLSDTFDDWLHRLYDGNDASGRISKPMQRYLDQAGLVERWAHAAGPHNVTVIIVDTANRDILTDTFEQLLGLPHHTLTGVTGKGSVNRSLTMPEAEILRQANTHWHESSVPWPLYLDLVYRGAVRRLRQRTPTPSEPRVRMSEWAAEHALRDGKLYADRIRDSGVRVVGDLEALYRQPPVAEEAIPATETDYQRDIAVEALTGAVVGAVKPDTNPATHAQETREHPKTKIAVRHQVQGLPTAGRPESAATAFTTRELIQALKLRIGRKIRSGKPGEPK